jgi:hypothetical protein
VEQQKIRFRSIAQAAASRVEASRLDCSIVEVRYRLCRGYRVRLRHIVEASRLGISRVEASRLDLALWRPAGYTPVGWRPVG